MKSCTILHISDLHVDMASNFDRSVVLDPLVERVKKDSDSGICPEIVAVTGDVAYAGMKTEYDKAKLFFDDLLNALKLQTDRLFIVPGNHDVNRKKYRPSDIPCYSDMVELNIELENQDYRHNLLAGFTEYFAFIEGHYPHLTSTHQRLVPFIVPFQSNSGKHIALVGLNSAWMCRKSPDKGKIAIGEYQIKKATEELAQLGGIDLAVALFHHPLEWLWPKDREICRKYLQGMMMLCGHCHEAEGGHIRDYDGGYFQFQAGCVYAGSSYVNRFQYITIDFNKRKIRLDFRAFNSKARKWHVDGTIGKDGKAEFDMPGAKNSSAPMPSVKTSRRNVLGDYVAQVLEEVSSWYDHLLQKKMSLRDHYVPHLAHIGGAEKGDTDESTILHDLRQHARAVIIEGPAGSGKTMLLRNWAASLAGENRNAEDAINVPLLVSLAHVADLCMDHDLDLGPGAVAARDYRFDVLGREQLQKALDWAINSGRAVLLYDAFDEVPSDIQPRIRTWLDRARRDARFCPIVVASRPCQLIHGFDQFNVYYLKGFNADQRRTFVSRWFVDAFGPEQAEHAINTLLAEPIMRDERIAGNPFFLTLACFEFERRGKLGYSPAGLLRYFYRQLLEKARHPRFSLIERTRVLEALGHYMFEKQKQKIGERKAVEACKGLGIANENVKNAVAVLAEIADSGLLVIGKNGSYEFRHHLFIDFFAASKILSSGGVDGANHWIGQHDYDEDRRSDQVIRFLQELIWEERR